MVVGGWGVKSVDSMLRVIGHHGRGGHGEVGGLAATERICPSTALQ